MKRHFFCLILSSAIFAVNPTLAMEDSTPLENSQHTLAHLKEQIAHVKEYLQTVHHPRLIFGVSNTEEANGNSGANPFLNNPTDIVADCAHTNGILENRTLTVDFNDLIHLKELASSFHDTFDIITTDYFVTKCAYWSKDHMGYFKDMLKPDGVLTFPIDANSSALSAIESNTKEELFLKTSQKLDLENDDYIFRQRGVEFYSFVEKLLISADQQELDQDVEKYKKLRPIYNVSTQEDKSQTKSKLSQLDFNPLLTSVLSKETLEDDIQLNDFVRGLIINSNKSLVKSKLSDEFIETCVIPQNWKRILGDVFESDKILIQQGMELPQPHRETLFSGWSIASRK